jgi:hypothetical protein
VIQGLATESLADDPAHALLFDRVITARMMHAPYIVVGGLFGMISLGLLAMENENHSPYHDYPSVLGPAVGFSLLATGIFAAIDGDRAVEQLGGRESYIHGPPGGLTTGAGLLLMGMGCGILTSFTPFSSFEWEFGDTNSPIPVSVATGLACIASGAVLAAAGARHWQASGWTRDGGWDGTMAIARRALVRHPRPVTIAGVTPLVDPHTETTGLALLGRF